MHSRVWTVWSRYVLILTTKKNNFSTVDILLKDGGLTLDSLFDTMCVRLGIYLQEIGLVQKGLVGMDLAKAAYTYCPHHVSHYLGMDVHDTSTVSRSIHLKPGMICTVEPGRMLCHFYSQFLMCLQWCLVFFCKISGVYIARDRKDVPEEFRGIGIRIEDDVLIASDHTVEVLTEKCIKDPALLTKQMNSWANGMCGRA